jgi:hypothetical protein
MDWRKELGRRSGERGWKDDFPLGHDLPDVVVVDCGKLETPIHPMFAVRLRVFVDWHRLQGRTVEVVPPVDARARRLFNAMRIADEGDGQEDDAVLPVTKMREFLEVEEVAKRTKEILEYDSPMFRLWERPRSKPFPSYAETRLSMALIRSAPM